MTNKEINEAIFEALGKVSVDSEAVKAVNEYTRRCMGMEKHGVVTDETPKVPMEKNAAREEAFMKKMLPPIPIKNDELDRADMTAFNAAAAARCKVSKENEPTK